MSVFEIILLLFSWFFLKWFFRFSICFIAVKMLKGIKEHGEKVMQEKMKGEKE